MKLRFAVGILGTMAAFILPMVAHAFTADFYVYNGISVSQVSLQNPEKYPAKSWEIWLYEPGKPTGGKDHWGVITAKTYDGALKELAAAQAFDKRYDRFMNIPEGQDKFVHTNTFGPVAITEAIRGQDAVIPKNFVDAYDKFRTARDVWVAINTILGKTHGANPFDGMGAFLQEYADSLDKARQQLRKLQQLLINVDQPAMDEIRDHLKEFSDDIKSSEDQQHAIYQKWPDMADAVQAMDIDAIDLMPGTNEGPPRLETIAVPDIDRTSLIEVKATPDGLIYTNTGQEDVCLVVKLIRKQAGQISVVSGAFAQLKPGETTNDPAAAYRRSPDGEFYGEYLAVYFAVAAKDFAFGNSDEQTDAGKNASRLMKLLKDRVKKEQNDYRDR